MGKRTAALFGREKVNTGRQMEIDMLKALCIVCMILLHTYEDLGCSDNVLYSAVDWLCAFLGAAAFMLCMGMGVRLSRHQAPKDYVLRGLELLTVGQLLNLLRNALPNLIAYRITGGQFFLANSLLVLQADILSFAGLSFLLIAVFRVLRLSDRMILGIGILMNLAGYVLAGRMDVPDHFLVNQLLGYFVLTKAEAYFPLLSYFVFVAAGCLIGSRYPYIRDKRALSGRVLAVFVPACALYYVLRFCNLVPFLPEFYSMEQYILQPGPDAAATILVSLIALALFSRITLRPEGRAGRCVRHISSNINQYYCISYVFILPAQTILMAVRGSLLTGWVYPTLYGIFVLIACYWIIEWNNRGLRFHVASLPVRKKVVLYAAVWILTIAVTAYAYPRIGTYATFWNDYLL